MFSSGIKSSTERVPTDSMISQRLSSPIFSANSSCSLEISLSIFLSEASWSVNHALRFVNLSNSSFMERVSSLVKLPRVILRTASACSGDTTKPPSINPWSAISLLSASRISLITASILEVIPIRPSKI